MRSAGTIAARGGALALAAVTAMLAGSSSSTADEIARFAGLGYGLALLVFAGFPKLRRNDLLMVVAAFLLSLALLRYLDGASAAISPLLFGLAGAAAAWLPSRIERFRSVERRQERRRAQGISGLIKLHGRGPEAAASRH